MKMRGEAHCQPAGWREPVQSGQLSCHLSGLPPGGGEGSDRDLASSRHDPSWHGLSWPSGQGPWRTIVPHFIFVPLPKQVQERGKALGAPRPPKRGWGALSPQHLPVPRAFLPLPTQSWVWFRGPGARRALPGLSAPALPLAWGHRGLAGGPTHCEAELCPGQAPPGTGR